MKTLRFIGMAIVAIIMSVNFVACSDDDDDIDVSQLEGTWGLVMEIKTLGMILILLIIHVVWIALNWLLRRYQIIHIL